MKLTPKEETTVKTYNEIAEDWSAQHTSRDYYKGELAQYKQLLPEGKILEIGVGGGRDAMELSAMGYQYVGTDVSEKLLEIARKNNPGLEFHHQSIYELQFSPDTFDGFWASAVLLHIPKDRIDEALERLHFVTKQNGIGFISLHKGEGESVKTDEKGDRYFSYYSPTEFESILRRNRFEVLERKEKKVDESKTWLYYFVKVIK